MVYESEFTVAVPVVIEGTGGVVESATTVVSKVLSPEVPVLDEPSVEMTRKWYVEPGVRPESVAVWLVPAPPVCACGEPDGEGSPDLTVSPADSSVVQVIIAPVVVIPLA